MIIKITPNTKVKLQSKIKIYNSITPPEYLNFFANSDLWLDATDISTIATGTILIDKAYTFGGSSSITIPSNPELAFGLGDYTVEFWLNLTNMSNVADLFDQRQNGNFAIYFQGRNYPGSEDRIQVGGSGSNWITSETKIIQNEWHHIAVTRENNYTKLFINGFQEGNSHYDTQNYASTSTRIGYGVQSSYLDGKMAGLRIVKGKALYTNSGFIPPSLPLEPITGVGITTPVIALQYNSPDSNGGNVVGINLTVNGTLPINYPNINFSYVAKWIDKSPNSLSATQNIFSKSPIMSPIYINGKGNLNMLQFDGVNDFFNLNQNISTSSPYACCFFVYNRAQNNIISASIGNKTTSNSSTYVHDSDNKVYGFDTKTTNEKIKTGLIVGAISKTNGLYLSQSNKCGLLLFDQPTISDSSIYKHSISEVGSFTSSSIVLNGGNTYQTYFDGNSYVSIPPTEKLAIRNTDFTVEFWFKITGSMDELADLFDQRTYPGNFGIFYQGTRYNSKGSVFNYAQENLIQVGRADQNLISSTTKIQQNTWYHIAVSRESGNLRFFLNGIQEGVTVFDQSPNANFLPTTTRIGYGQQNSYLNGYISNLRFCKSAVYTSNFTVPTPPLESKPFVKQLDYTSNWNSSGALLNSIGTHGTSRHKGNMGEIVVLSEDLSNSDIEEIGEGLMEKWGML